MNDQQRKERDLAALQTELLTIEQRLSEIQPEILELTKTHLESGAMLKVRQMEVKLMKERKSALQSVLKSVSQF